jgi:hypothetical protein
MEANAEASTPEEKHSFNWRMFLIWPFVIVVVYVFDLKSLN